MKVRYLFRLDDACPTMRREIWDPLNEALTRLSIRPIVSIIPDNLDLTVLFSDPDQNFWEKVGS